MDTLQSVLDVQQFAFDRLVDNWREFPRTTYMLLGEVGHVRRKRSVVKFRELLDAIDHDALHYEVMFTHWHGALSKKLWGCAASLPCSCLAAFVPAAKMRKML